MEMKSKHDGPKRRVVEREGMEPLVEVHRFGDGMSILIPKSCEKTFDKIFGE